MFRRRVFRIALLLACTACVFIFRGKSDTANSSPVASNAAPFTTATSGSPVATPQPVPPQPSASPIPRHVVPALSAPTANSSAVSSAPQTAAAQPLSSQLSRDAEKLASRETHPNAVGELERASLLRSKMKYPLLRMEETLRKEGSLGDERVIKQIGAVADHVVVTVQPNIDEKGVAALAQRHGSRVKERIGATNSYLLAIKPDDLDSLPRAIADLSNDQAVKRAEPDYVVQSHVTPNDTNFGQLWGLNNTGQTGGAADSDIDAPEAWQMLTGSPTVVVGVIDTGIDYNHPDLAPNIWTNPGEIAGNGIDDDHNGYVDDVRGWNFVSGNNNPNDDNFHGSHVAGTLGAAGNNGSGVTGVNWAVKIIPLKFLDNNGYGFTSDAAAAIRYATRAGVRLTSNSWGGGGYSQVLKDAIDEAAAAGILFVASAGNEASNNDTTPVYPASYTSSNILTVAASDHNDQLAGFSNYGLSVHLTAPGVGILSTFPTVVTSSMIYYGLSPNYGTISGTSMAAPHVSGVAALLFAQSPGLNAMQVRARILDRTDRLIQFVNKLQTSGRLNAFNVVNPNWQPTPAQLVLTKVALTDEGNGDGYPNPGEIIRLTPELLNIGGQSATAVTFTLVSNDSAAVVLSPATLNCGNVDPFVPFTSPTPLRVQLNASIADNTLLTFDAVVHRIGGADQHVPYNFVVSRPKPRAEVSTDFALGEMKADPVRNLVYLINKSDFRVMALNTDTGAITAVANLDGSPIIEGPAQNGSLVTGHMAISHDGARLYVALSGARKIQVFSLPDLSPLVSLPVNFQPISLAVDANGRLYASSSDFFGNIREVNTTNGLVVQTIDKGAQRANVGFYLHSLLRMNAAGTRLYVSEPGLLVVGGPGYMFEYNVTGANAVLVKEHPFVMAYMQDFGVDEQQQRLYTVNLGYYGVQVTDMATDEYGELWPIVRAATGLAFLPNEPVIYGASGDPYEGMIRKFRRSDGLILGDYVVSTSGDPIPPRALAITPNGNLVYIKLRWTGMEAGGAGDGYEYFLGIIGRGSLQIVNPPPVTTGPNISLSTVNFGDLEGNSDGVPNAGEIIALAPALLNTGGQNGLNATIEIAAGTGATLLSSGSQSLGSIPAGGTVSATPFRIQLAPGLATGSTITFTFTARWNGNQTKTFVYTMVIRATALVGELPSDLQLGEILADQQRNIVYVIDKRFGRLLAFDTNSGRFTKAITLAGSPQSHDFGMMAQSVDGSRLFIALKQSKMIQCISLPDLTTVWSASYSFAPYALATDAAGHLYANSPTLQNVLNQIDANTGAFISSQRIGFDVGADGPFRRNAGGTRLYCAAGNTIFRYSTGLGQPTLLNALVTSSYQIFDFALDEALNRFYVIGGDDKLQVVPLTGNSATWNLNQLTGSAVSYIPGDNEVLGGSDYVYGGGIRRFDRNSGNALQDYILSSGDNGFLTVRGLATTPNRRTVYVKRAWRGAVSSVDGYVYWLGMIGGPVDLDIPGPAPIVLKSVTLNDASPGNADGYPNPGETIQLSPTFKNLSDFQAANVSVNLISAEPLAVVQAPSTQNFGTVNGGATFGPPANFRIALNSGLTDGAEIKLTWRVTYNGSTEQLISQVLYVAKPAQAESEVFFQIGEMLGDPARNVVYVVDETTQRILGVDTANGGIAAQAKLASAPNGGSLAISTDGSRLYVALPMIKMVQIFNLPALEEADLLPLDFAAYILAPAADGRLYANDYSQFNDRLRQVDLFTGRILGSFGIRSYYSPPLLRLSNDGRSLFASSTTFGLVDEYAIDPAGSGLPIFSRSIPFTDASLIDMQIDETFGRVYFVQGGTYGVGYTQISNAIAGFFWPFNAAYGSAMCFLPGDKFVYGGSGGTYDGRIRRFERATGKPLADFSTVSGNSTILPKAMAITGNGRVIYGKKEFTGNASIGINGYRYWLGIIGRTSLLTNFPNRAPLVKLGNDQTARLSQALPLTAVLEDDGQTNFLTTTWKLVSGPAGGNATFSPSTGTSTAVSFSTVGVYRVRATTSDGSRQGSDEINVNVVPDIPAITINATNAVASEYRQRPGILTISRTGVPYGDVIVNISASGSATSVADYFVLPSTVTIPDGAGSVQLAITPVCDFGADPDETVVVTLATSPNYNLGNPTQATVTIRDLSFVNWQAEMLGGLPADQQTPNADPNHNGLSNLLEYALGSDPAGIGPFPGPTVGITDDYGDGNKYLFIRYRRLTGNPGITYTVQATSDARSWPAGQAYTYRRFEDQSDGTQIITETDTVPMTSGVHRFMRLRVSQP